METTVTFLAALVSFAMLDLGWRMWKSVMREILRDRLIDLRDEWRDHFAGRGLDMAAPAYARLRDTLNAQLQYTRHLRFGGFIYTLSRITPEQGAFLDERARGAFDSCDAETRRLVASIRNRSSEAVLRYIMLTSVFVVLFAPFAVATRVSGLFSRSVRAVVRNTLSINASAVERASRTFGA